MGYTTEFEGRLKFDKPLNPDQVAYINKFSETRRMVRNPLRLAEMPDPIREAVGLPVGDSGEYFVGGGGIFGQRSDPSVIDFNKPPRTQHSLWCDWIVSEDGTELYWNESEKFYNYVEWLKYLIQHFFAFWGYKLNGQIKWRGERFPDRGIIHVNDNVVTTEDE